MGESIKAGGEYSGSPFRSTAIFEIFCPWSLVLCHLSFVIERGEIDSFFDRWISSVVDSPDMAFTVQFTTSGVAPFENVLRGIRIGRHDSVAAMLRAGGRNDSLRSGG